MSTPAANTDQIPRKRQFDAGLLLILLLGLLKLMIHLISNQRYGFHRDELLYLALGQHLDWGYMEIPPMLPALGAVARQLFGDSLLAVRIIPALCGATVVVLTGLMVRELKGGVYAQVLACLAALVPMGFLIFHTLFQPNCLDHLFWTVGYYLLFRYVCTTESRYIVLIGITAGLGLLAKYTLLFWLGGVVGAMLLTQYRRLLATRPFWWAVGCALLLVLPNVWWQYGHDFPFLAHSKGLYKHELQESRAEFVLIQMLVMHPLTVPIWVSGIVFFFRQQNRAYRLFGYCWAITFLLLFLSRGKAYYLLSVYPLLFAGGSVQIERWMRHRAQVIRLGYPVLLAATGLLLLPLSTPVLPLESFVRYFRWLVPASVATDDEDRPVSMPEYYAEMMGWPEELTMIQQAYQALSPADRQQCVIFASNYGQAGAVSLFGDRYGLPPVVCTSGSFYLRKPVGEACKTAVAIGVNEARLKSLYADVKCVSTFTYPYADEEQNMPIYICRHPLVLLSTQWPAYRGEVFE